MTTLLAFITLVLNGVNFWSVAELGPTEKGPKIWENMKIVVLFLNLCFHLKITYLWINKEFGYVL